MHKVFVYGTLKAGFGNHHILEESKFLQVGETEPTFTMISLGGFPGILDFGTTSIKGEVYEVDKETLARLDRLEGHPRWYKRTPITLNDGFEVETYIYPSDLGYGKEVIESGSWRSK